jgi:hypothetical protein
VTKKAFRKYPIARVRKSIISLDRVVQCGTSRRRGCGSYWEASAHHPDYIR